MNTTNTTPQIQQARYHGTNNAQIIGFAECSYYNGSKAAYVDAYMYQLRAASPGGDGYRLIIASDSVEELQLTYATQPSSNRHFAIFKVR